MSKVSSDLEFQLRKIAGIGGAIQALAWAVMAIICIVYFLEDTYLSSADSYMGQIGLTMYIIFLARQMEQPFPAQVLRPAVFSAFMWVYLTLNAMWLVLSLRMTRKSNARQSLVKITALWSKLTFLICTVDFILVCCLGADFYHCVHMYGRATYSSEEACSNGILLVLVIAARGFVLWIVNVVFAVVLHKMSNRMKKDQHSMITAMGPQVMVRTGHGPLFYQITPQNYNSHQTTYPGYQQYRQ